MASILFSFVGNQDPVSHNTNEEGSIVTLVRYLLAQQNHQKLFFYILKLRQKGQKKLKNGYSIF